MTKLKPLSDHDVANFQTWLENTMFEAICRDYGNKNAVRLLAAPPNSADICADHWATMSGDKRFTVKLTLISADVSEVC